MFAQAAKSLGEELRITPMYGIDTENILGKAMEEKGHRLKIEDHDMYYNLCWFPNLVELSLLRCHVHTELDLRVCHQLRKLTLGSMSRLKELKVLPILETLNLEYTGIKFGGLEPQPQLRELSYMSRQLE